MPMTNTEKQRAYRSRLMIAAGRGNYVLDLDSEPGTMCPLEYMLTVLNDPNVPTDIRLKAASMAAPYIHAKQDSIPSGKKEERDAAAEEANKGQFASANPPQLAKAA